MSCDGPQCNMFLFYFEVLWVNTSGYCENIVRICSDHKRTQPLFRRKLNNRPYHLTSPQASKLELRMEMEGLSENTNSPTGLR